MELIWGYFDQIGVSRITQLINKTNQFNLRTRRYTEAEIASILTESNVFGLQMRLLDRFGDNGIVGIVICHVRDNGECFIDTWLMSCRVLGRGVEEATLNIIAQEAQRFGAAKLIGEYLPTQKNNMVAHHYEKLGFEVTLLSSDGVSINSLPISDFKDRHVLMRIRRTDQ
jgi:FkbH-like protein